MRYADAYTQQQLERVTSGRPASSSGWGMLIACKTSGYVSERNPADHVTIEAGKTRVSRDYWLARERPELFKPADNRDARTYREHSANARESCHEHLLSPGGRGLFVDANSPVDRALADFSPRFFPPIFGR